MEQINATGHRLERLDHLRAVAAILVLFWHMATPKSPVAEGALSILQEGHTGVSLFCVISGFIFAYLYLDKPVGYGEFMRKRLLRVMPMIVVYLVLAFYSSGMTPADLLTILTGTIKYGQILTNYTGQMWSVLVELQFYLLFPFLIAFTRRWGAPYLIGLLILIVAIRWGLYMHVGSVQAQGYWTIMGRLDQFLAGMIAGVLMRSPVMAGIWMRWLTALAGLAGLVAILTFFYLWRSKTGGLVGELGPIFHVRQFIWIFIPSIEGLSYAAIVAAYVGIGGDGRAWLPIRLVSHGVGYIGRISYSLYMNQFFVLFAFSSLFAMWQPTTWEMGLVKVSVFILPVMIIVSSATYYLIERPFLTLKDGRRPNIPSA